jgi:hypothetical protein
MSSRPVWSNPIEAAAWQEKHCRVCFQADEARRRVTGQGDGCPIWIVGLANKLPTQWTRRRNAVMGDTYRCAEFAKQPPVNRRPVAPAEVQPLFDLETAERFLIPVEGWPDWRAEKRKGEGEHQ